MYNPTLVLSMPFLRHRTRVCGVCTCECGIRCAPSLSLYSTVRCVYRKVCAMWARASLSEMIIDLRVFIVSSDLSYCGSAVVHKKSQRRLRTVAAARHSAERGQSKGQSRRPARSRARTHEGHSALVTETPGAGRARLLTYAGPRASETRLARERPRQHSLTSNTELMRVMSHRTSSIHLTTLHQQRSPLGEFSSCHHM